MRRIITKNLRTSVYNALINSHLAYGISKWGSSASQVKLKNLFVLQKKAIRNLFGIKKESKNVKGHTKRTFNDNNILTVHNLASYFTISCISQRYRSISVAPILARQINRIGIFFFRYYDMFLCTDHKYAKNK